MSTQWGHTDCTPDYPCYSCLATEVEALRAQMQAVRRLTFEWLQNSTCPPWCRINAIRNISDGTDE